jgi:hypothetical protein
VETIDCFLRRYREEVIRKRKAAQDIKKRTAHEVPTRCRPLLIDY